ncbi:hypothetical protein [Thalassospira alkalitolerans]|uniref:Methyltransferase type 11 domain-containing protein n=1 Tax=Thalassospira alkalitolerans TaxID=1293890 RepID=A0A1Y2L6S0_9PROT|nr:hypothetical protein [Thalassospira alkalitolerans]OSQ44287.1 hypothetical protein TALK_19265 [Thalassospira alkalitolerans]
MAIDIRHIVQMIENGYLTRETRFLDIGCSNLYNATEQDISDILKKFDVIDVDFCQRLASMSVEKSAFAGELIDRIGAHYDAIDFAIDYKTTKFDLNKDNLPSRFRGKFDLICNFGTTEHVINQDNSFRVIHDGAKHNGLIWHQLPCGGFFNHCYFLYTGRFFFDLAGYNEYEVVAAWLGQVNNSSNLMSPFKDYSSYFNALTDVQEVPHPTMPDTVFNIIYRKVKNVPFRRPMELSTSYTKPDNSQTQSAREFLRKTKRLLGGLIRQ